MYLVEILWKQRKNLKEAIKDTIKDYKEIIFGLNTLVCMACLNELRKQQTIDQHVYNQKLIDDTIRKILWWMVIQWLIKGQARRWVLRLILHTGKINFKSIFIVFIDLKITYRMVVEIHILNDIDTLGTWRICDFA